jgi:exonuclease III
MITKWEMINPSTKHLTAYGVTFYISNIYAPNNGKERKSFFNAINDTLFKYTDDSDKNYSLIVGDVCVLPYL